MGHQGVDMRPHFVRKEGTEILVDSGSQICAWPPDPGDQIDPNIRLKAVNGNHIQCFGSKDIMVKIGRKAYKFKAIKANVPGPIIRWDFIRHYKLDFVWGEGNKEAYIREKKAKIKAPLKYKSVPLDQSRDLSRLSVLSKPLKTFQNVQDPRILIRVAMICLSSPGIQCSAYGSLL